MKKAVQTKQFTELDNAIKTQVEPMLYNNGEGRMIPIAKLVLLRNRDRSRARWVSKNIAIHAKLFYLRYSTTVFGYKWILSEQFRKTQKNLHVFLSSKIVVINYKNTKKLNFNEATLEKKKLFTLA